MATFGLVRRSTGELVRRQDFTPPAPALSPLKDLRWVPDNPPVFDSTFQTRTVVEPIPEAAMAIPYLVSVIPLEVVKAQRKDSLREIAAGKLLDAVLQNAEVAFRTNYNSHTTAIDGLPSSQVAAQYDITTGW